MNQSIDEEIVRDYCQHHELNRPDVNIRKAIWILALVILFVFTMSYILSLLVDFPFLFWVDLLLLIIVLCFGRTFFKFLIKCYQRYASERTRRQCSCMPSCSEYALLALDKYFLPKALWKIWRRVMHTCSLPGYHIDYP